MSRAPCLPLLLCGLLVVTACGGAGGTDDGGLVLVPPGGPPPISETRVVTTLADDGPGSLRQIVDDASAGALVTFDPAIAGGTVSLLSEIVIDKALRIDGSPSGGVTTIDAGGSSRHLNVQGSPYVLLQDLVLTNASSAGQGGAIYASESRIVLRHVRVELCETLLHGGALYAYGCQVDLADCNLSACTAEGGGALCLVRSATRMAHCSCTWNTANDGGGGAISVLDGSFVAHSVTVHDNASLSTGATTVFGGGIYASQGPAAGPVHVGLYACTVTSNVCDDLGGGLYVETTTAGNLVCRQTILAGNGAPSGPDLGVQGPLDVESAYNLVGELAGGPIWNGLDGNIVGDAFTPEDPMLGPAVGGPQFTLSRTPLPGSPVRDVVPHAACLDDEGDVLETDQLFADRLADGAADIGAIEAQP